MSKLSETDERLSVRPAERLPATSLKVNFYPSTDDLAYAAQRINRAYRFPARAQYAMFAFLALNMFGLPFALWYFEEPLTALAILVLSVVFASLFAPALLKADYRHYFNVMYGSIENQVTEVELTEDGVWCRRQGDHGFYAWKSVKELEETKTAIHFVLTHSALTVAKTGFAYDDEKDRFLEFAKARVPRFNTV